MIKAVLFDLDDTLFDHRGCAREALTQLRRMVRAFEARTLEELERDYHRLLEELHLKVIAGEMSLEASRQARFRELLRLAGVEADEAFTAQVARLYHEAYLAAYRPPPGAVALLQALEGRAKVGIVTNNITSEQVRKIQACGLERFIDALVVSDEAGACKPEPAIFELALARLGARAQEAVMIGDAWATDILGARAAGIRAIWFNRLGLPCPDPALADEIRSLAPAAAVLELIFRS